MGARKRSKPKALSAQQAAAKIRIPLGKWPENCTTIANAFLEQRLVTGRLCYGLWRGPIASGSPFAGRSFTHHSWIELEDGSVCDPTRYVFEHVAPYIYMGPADYYDFGGNELHRQTRSPAPKFNPRAPVEDFPKLKPVVALLGLPPYNEAQLFWLANAHPAELGDSIATVYAALAKLDHEAWIPLDNRRRYLEPQVA